jgi:hypothetical protein
MALQSGISTSGRIRRGFNRIGYVLAIPILVVGLLSAIGFGFSSADSKQRRFSQLVCIQKKAETPGEDPPSAYDKNRVDVRKWGCDGPIWDVAYADIFDPLPPKPDFLTDFSVVFGSIAATTLVLAAVSFGLFSALGWIVAGFARD